MNDNLNRRLYRLNEPGAGNLLIARSFASLPETVPTSAAVRDGEAEVSWHVLRAG